MRMRFGDCLFDSDTRELFRGEEPVHLQPKVFRLLELLVENRPRALSKDELHEKVWPGTFVSEATLASAISDIRAAIGKGGRDSNFIRTVHGYGYAFSGEAKLVRAATVNLPSGGVEWRLIWDDREIALSEGENLLGRDHEAAIWLDSKGVSRHHARIWIDGYHARLEDLGSKNGTFLNGRKLVGGSDLEDDDEIRVGSVAVKIRALVDRGTTETRGTV